MILILSFFVVAVVIGVVAGFSLRFYDEWQNSKLPKPSEVIEPSKDVIVDIDYCDHDCEIEDIDYTK